MMKITKGWLQKVTVQVNYAHFKRNQHENKNDEGK